MIDKQFFFDQLVKANLKIYDNIRKIATGQENYYMTSCLLDYNHYNKYYKMLTTDSSKQHVLHADLKAMQEIYFTGNLNRREIANDKKRCFSLLNKQKKPCQIFHK